MKEDTLEMRTKKDPKQKAKELGKGSPSLPLITLNKVNW